MRKSAVSLLALACVVLTGCGGEDKQATPVIALAALPSTGKTLATVWLSPTPPPASTEFVPPTTIPEPTLALPTISALQPTLPIATNSPIESTPGADETPLANTSDCAELPPEPFASAWQSNPQAQGSMGCVAGDVEEITAAFQRFEQGYMLWIQSEGAIYVLSDSNNQQGQASDTWWKLADTFTESDPDVDASLSPPAGLQQPRRGFGKVWRNNGFVRQALGWAVDSERGFSTGWLNFDNGWMMTSPGNDKIFILLLPEGGENTGTHFSPYNN